MEPFQEHDTLRAIIEAVLEGRVGRLTQDDPKAVRLSRIELGCFAIFSGDVDHPQASEWLLDLPSPIEIVLPPSQAWRDLADRLLGDRLEDRPMRSYDPTALDRESLERRVATCDERFRIRPLDPEAAAQLGEAFIPHALQTFRSPQDFSGDAFGFGAFTADGRLACQSSSYAICSRRVEVSISTAPDFRRLGLAGPVAATMLLESLRRGIRPEWCASNPISKRLARSLGYRPAGLCDIVYFT